MKAMPKEKVSAIFPNDGKMTIMTTLKTMLENEMIVALYCDGMSLFM